MSSINLVYIVALLVVYLMWTHRSQESYETQTDKTTCRKLAAKSVWGDYDWTTRIMNKGAWKCPSGWQNTGCTWDMGREFQTKQCRRKKSGGGGTQEEKDAKRSSVAKGLVGSIRIHAAEIKRLGGTPKGSTRAASANASDTALMARLDVLKKQLAELQSGPAPSTDAAQSSAGSVGTDSEKAGLLSSIETIHADIVNAGGKAPKKNTYPNKSVEQLKAVYDTLKTKLENLKKKSATSTFTPISMSDPQTTLINRAMQLKQQEEASRQTGFASKVYKTKDGQESDYWSPDGSFVGLDKVDWNVFGCNVSSLGGAAKALQKDLTISSDGVCRADGYSGNIVRCKNATTKRFSPFDGSSYAICN